MGNPPRAEIGIEELLCRARLIISRTERTLAQSQVVIKRSARILNAQRSAESSDPANLAVSGCPVPSGTLPPSFQRE
jgi:hypothetical protein